MTFTLKCFTVHVSEKRGFTIVLLQVFQENPDIQEKMKTLKSEDFRDAYPRFPPIQVTGFMLLFCAYPA